MKRLTKAGMNKNQAKSLLNKINLRMRNSNFPVYTISFIEEPKKLKNKGLLSQWRGYGDNGKGVRIGIRAEEIEENFRIIDSKYIPTKNFENCKPSKTVNTIFCKCIYQENKKRKFINALINKVYEPNKKIYPVTLINEVFDEFYKYAAVLKDEAYAEENEWRLIFTNIPSSLIQYDAIQPYCNIKVFFANCYNSILLGPCAEQEFSSIKINFHLMRNNIIDINKVEILKKSTIPYRG